jgi:hypothetical protein
VGGVITRLSKEAPATLDELRGGAFCPGKSDLERTFPPTAVTTSPESERANGIKNARFFTIPTSARDVSAAYQLFNSMYPDFTFRSQKLRKFYPSIPVRVNVKEFHPNHPLRHEIPLPRLANAPPLASARAPASQGSKSRGG